MIGTRIIGPVCEFMTTNYRNLYIGNWGIDCAVPRTVVVFVNRHSSVHVDGGVNATPHQY